MSDTHEENGNLDDEAKEAKIEKLQLDGAALKKWLLDKDIRVIIHGETHNVDETCLSLQLVQDLKPLIKAIYLEHCVETDSPQTEYQQFQKYIQEKFANNENQSDDGNSFDGFKGGSTEIINAMLEQKEAEKLHPFGCNDHTQTLATLATGAKEVKKDQLIVISVGSNHLFQISDPLLSEETLLRPGTENDEVDADYVQVDREHVEQATFTDSREGIVAISSLGLVEQLSQLVDCGILVINGSWWASRPLKKYIAERDGLATNQSMLSLTERLQHNKRIYLAKNYLEWNSEYFTLVANNRQGELFDRYEEFLEKFIPDFIYNHLFRTWFGEISRAYEYSGQPDNQSNLYFTTLQKLMPSAKDPFEVLHFAKENSDDDEDDQYEAEDANAIFDE